MSGSPLLPSGPGALNNGRCPVFVEHGADPSEEPGLQAPPGSICVFGSDYFIKCGPGATDWDPPACGGGGGFRLISVSPLGSDDGPAGYEFINLLVNSSYAGPLVLTFNAPPDPDTLTTLQVDTGGMTPPAPWSGPESMRVTYDLKLSQLPLSFAVVGNTIEISNPDGNEWGFNLTGRDGELYIQLTADLTDTDGNPLANPGDAAFWSFISDD